MNNWESNLVAICIIAFFTTIKLFLSCYFCLKKKFRFSTITLFSFILNFGISSFICMFVKHDTIAVMIVLYFGAVSFILSASNIMFTFFFKLFRKRFSSFRFTLLFFLLAELFNIIGIPTLISNTGDWVGGDFLTYYNYGVVVVFLSLLIWYFFEMKNEKRKSSETQGSNRGVGEECW